MKRRLRAIRGEGSSVRAEINVTSLVDVAFTLLIIFMITAPILQGGVEIDVPETSAGPITASDAMVVSIDRNGQIYLDDAPITMDEFDAAIGPALETRESQDVLLNGDRELQYDLVLRVLGRLTAAGASSVVLISNPEPARR